MKKLFALLLVVMLMCGCTVALGEEAEKIDAGVYTFTLPEGVTAEPECIADGVYGFVANGDGFEIIGVTIDYAKQETLKLALEAENNVYEAHMKVALGMVLSEVQLSERLEIQVDDSGEAMCWSHFAMGDINVFVFSRYENETGFMLMLAWEQEEPTFTELEKKQKLVRTVAVSGMRTSIMRVRIIKDNTQLWKEAQYGSATWPTVDASDHFPYIGEINDFYIIDYFGNTAYVYKENAKLE